MERVNNCPIPRGENARFSYLARESPQFTEPFVKNSFTTLALVVLSIEDITSKQNSTQQQVATIENLAHVREQTPRDAFLAIVETPTNNVVLVAC